jgi:L-iditol 2-dehydrogenase
VIRRAGARLDTLITHRFALDRVQEAWELQLTGACGKVLLLPNG